MFNNIISIQRITLDRGKSRGRSISSRPDAGPDDSSHIVNFQLNRNNSKEDSMVLSDFKSRTSRQFYEKTTTTEMKGSSKDILKMVQQQTQQQRDNPSSPPQNEEDLQFYQRTTTHDMAGHSYNALVSSDNNNRQASPIASKSKIKNMQNIISDALRSPKIKKNGL